MFECKNENYENEEDLPHAGWNSWLEKSEAVHRPRTHLRYVPSRTAQSPARTPLAVSMFAQ